MGDEEKSLYSDNLRNVTMALPLVILVYLLCNFIFNAGYFYILGIKFMGLLSMQDYYEGTAPFMAFIFCFFSGFFNVSTNSIESVMYLPGATSSYLNSHIYLPARIIFIKLLMKKKLFFLKWFKRELLYSKKRTYVDVIKKLKDIEKHLKKDIAPLSTTLLFNIIICLFFIFCPLYYFYTKIYFVDKTMFYLMFSIWVIYAFLLVKLEVLYKKIILTIVASTLFLFFLGVYMFECNIKNTTTIVQLKNKCEYKLVRSMSRGVIFVDENYIIKFVKWDDVNQFSKDVTKSFKKE